MVVIAILNLCNDFVYFKFGFFGLFKLQDK